MNVFLGLMNIFCSLLFIGLAIPLYKEKIEMNMLYGMRIPKAFKSEENWYKINKYSGKRMIIWSVPLLAAGFIILFLPPLDETGTLMAGLLPLIVLIPSIEGILYARKL